MPQLGEKMHKVVIGTGRYSSLSFEEATLLSKLNIPASNIKFNAGKASWELELPDNQGFDIKIKSYGTCKNTFIYYKELPVICFNENKHNLYVHQINDLETEKKLPEQSQEVKESLKQYQQKKQYEIMEQEYIHICDGYIKKLQNDLKKFKNRVNNNVEYQEPNDKTSLDHLAWEKLRIVTKANNELLNKDRNPDKNIKACIDELQKSENVAILSKRRDSWLVGAAKIAFSLGTIVIYRALMADQGVTQSMRNVNLFVKKYQKLKDSEPKNTKEQESELKKSYEPEKRGPLQT